MAKRDTNAFLKWLNEQNAQIAEAEGVKADTGVGLDPVREQRQEERREKLGTLRAREHPGKRPRDRITSVFGNTKLH